MKNKMRILIASALVLCVCASSVLPVTAANISKNIQVYTVSRQDLLDRVTKTVKKGQISYTSLYNIDSLPRTDLQNAAQSSRSAGGKVFFYFDTLINDRVTGRIIVNPFLVKDGDGNLSLIVDTTEDTNKTIKEKFEKIFGSKVAAMRCSQQEAFGMTVVLAGKLDLTGMDAKNLIAYSYNEATDKYSLIANANCIVDDQGFLYLETKSAGYIIVTEKK